MRVFVTGATGWIGSAVVKELLSSGHKVVGLTTTTDGARKLQALGAKARVGRLQDHALLREGAADFGRGDPPGLHPRVVEHEFADSPPTVRRGRERRDRPELSENPCGNGVGRHPGFGRWSRKLRASFGRDVGNSCPCRRVRFRPNATTTCRAVQTGHSPRQGLSIDCTGSPVLHRAPSTHRAWRRGTRFHVQNHRGRAQERRFALHWRRRQPMAGGACLRRGAPLSSRA